MLGDTEAIIDRPIAAGRIEPGRASQFLRVNARRRGNSLRRMMLLGDKARPGFEIGRIAALADEVLVHEALGDDDMRQSVQYGDIGSRP